MKLYRKKGSTPMYPYDKKMILTSVSISEADKLAGSPKEGDMIAYNPDDPMDRWLIAKKYFEDNYEEI